MTPLDRLRFWLIAKLAGERGVVLNVTVAEGAVYLPTGWCLFAGNTIDCADIWQGVHLLIGAREGFVCPALNRSETQP